MRNWNAQQIEILRDAAEGVGDTVVLARAGTGKTTTMLEAAVRLPGYTPTPQRGSTIVYLAFNTRNKDEVTKKAPPGIEVRTFHSLGRGGLFLFAKGMGRALPEEPLTQKTHAIIDRRWPTAWDTEHGRCGGLVSAVGFAKNTLGSTCADIERIVSERDLDIGTDPESPRYAFELARFCADVITILDLSVRAFKEFLDYDMDDMIWLPVRLSLRIKQYQSLIVDEGQDLNPCQHALVKMARRMGGRVILVGDDYQAIYAWRGAAQDGIESFRASVGAKVLRLPVTYRCGKAIVALARTVCPDYEAAETNGEGAIEYQSIRAMVASAAPGDSVISRVNAPLVKLCFELLKAGKKARVIGKNVGGKLLRMLADAGRDGVATVPALVKWVEEWRKHEIARAEARKPPSNTDPINDDAECLIALSEGVASFVGVRTRIESLFTDDPTADEIALSSCHKAKGLEWRRVYMIEDTFRPSFGTEERNLWYVAVTRAIEVLVMVSDRYLVAPAPVAALAVEVITEEPAPPEPAPALLRSGIRVRINAAPPLGRARCYTVRR